MRAMILPVAIVAALGMSSMAFADDITGELQAVDPAARTITLADGMVLTVPESMDWTVVDGFKIGDKIMVVATPVGDVNEVESISPAE